MNKKPALVVFEDGVKELEAAAHAMRPGLEALALSVKVRAASKVTIPEILAARVFAFGVDDPEAPSYGEIKRVLAGINLAGRYACVFSLKKGAAAEAMRKSAADSELGFAKDARASDPEVLAASVAAGIKDRL